MHANFVKIEQFLFFEVHSALNCLKTKNCPILTKFGVHIVWSMVIVKIKNIFEKINFLKKFFSWAVHCAALHPENLKKF